MSEIAALISDHLGTWSAATERKNGAGRGGGKRVSLYGIERLRALILDLAVRGKLVPQVASDEPASELMKRVGQVREALEGKGKKAAAAIPPTDVPAGWVAVPLADLAYPQAGFAFKSVGFNELGVGLPLIRIRDVGQPFTGTFYSGDYRDDFVVHEGDYLISMDGEFRVATWNGPEALLNQRVSRLQFYGDEVVRPFVAMALQTELTQLQGVKAYTTVDHLSGKQIAGSVIRVPPLAEQRRITAKVNELMALCDALEGESAAALAAHQTLVETLLTTLVASADVAELTANWARLEAHFFTLFTTEASVDALKQAILDMAVRGRLVEQEAEPSDTLAAIAAERQAMAAAKQIRLKARTTSAIVSTPPFEAPRFWQWSKLGELGGLENGDRGREYPNKSALKLSGIPFVNAGHLENGVVNSSLMTFISDEHFARLGGGKFQDGDILYCLRGSLGKAGLVSGIGRGAIASSLVIIRLAPSFLRSFMMIYLGSSLAQTMIKKYDNGTAQPNLSSDNLAKFLVPVPPLAEQQRIVAKVDALMALCNDLKARTADAGRIQMRLADAIVERAAA